MARQWILTGQEGFESSLEYQTDVKIPTAQELGPHDVLVKIEAASLNYRELVIAGPMVCAQKIEKATLTDNIRVLMVLSHRQLFQAVMGRASLRRLDLVLTNFTRETES